MPPKDVVIHPLVLLSVVDHYNRVAKGTRRRVVGVLLGEIFRGKVDVTNSFAVPFEEDKRDPTVWFLDHNYLEEMGAMFHRVNASERIVGFYSTGPAIRPADLEISEMFRKFCKDPVFAIIDIRLNREDTGLPVKAYISAEEVRQDGSETKRVFKHIASEIGAYQAEEVGVEHLLRDINDHSVSTLAEKVRDQITALNGLKSRLLEMSKYIDDAASGALVPNNQIIYNIQNIVNLLPNLNLTELIKAFMVKTNDAHLVLYITSIIRSITALHDLVNNKLKFSKLDQIEEKGEKEETAATAKEESKKDSAAKGGTKEGEAEAKSAKGDDMDTA